MAGYFSSLDVDFGTDFIGKFSWMTPAGRLSLIHVPNALTDEVKSTIPANTSSIYEK